jgi:hypothetical protein
LSASFCIFQFSFFNLQFPFHASPLASLVAVHALPFGSSAGDAVGDI